MRKPIIFFLLTIYSQCSVGQAQAGNIGQVVTRPYHHKMFTDIDGTPLLFEEWYPGRIILVGGGTIENVFINYDAYEDLIVFREAEKEFDLPSGVQYFIVKPGMPDMKDSMMFRGGYPAVDDNTGKTFYEVLSDGPLSLLKCYRKITGLSKENAFVSNKREFVISEDYYLGRSGNPPIKIKKDKNSLLKALSDKQDLLDAYIREKKINCRTEDGMAAVVKKYNEQ